MSKSPMYIKKSETRKRKSAKILRVGGTVNEQKLWKLKLYESKIQWKAPIVNRLNQAEERKSGMANNGDTVVQSNINKQEEGERKIIMSKNSKIVIKRFKLTIDRVEETQIKIKDTENLCNRIVTGNFRSL